ncbi:MAG TPA: alpha/beta hydrolase [Planctomycetota bacterium]|nr:alpha/beta hydrolase [Planctomycetota bacterium]
MANRAFQPTRRELLMAGGLACLAPAVLSGKAEAGGAPAVKNVVLVHGAFADGTSWFKVIPQLLAKGLKVTSVGIPLTSFADDVAATKRAIGTQEGPVLLVGHSYGGLVITEAGNDPKVAGLVYVAAFAPDAGQTIPESAANYPKPPGLQKLVQLPDGFIILSDEAVETDLAQDCTKDEKALFIAVQRQTSGSVFGAKATAAAWKSKPNWYIVANNDRMIAPEQEKDMANKINARTTVLQSSHVPMLSKPQEVAKVIEDAVEGLGK